MTPAQIYRTVHEAGLTLRADGSQLVVRPARRLTPSLRMLLIAQKSSMLTLLADARCTAKRLVDLSQRAPAALWQPDLFDTRQEQVGSRRDPGGLPSGDSRWNRGAADTAPPATSQSN